MLTIWVYDDIARAGAAAQIRLDRKLDCEKTIIEKQSVVSTILTENFYFLFHSYTWSDI